MFYGARYYSPLLGRFVSADSIVPNPSNPQSLNRFSYTRNNPLKYIDPNGHKECDLQWGCEGKPPESQGAPLQQSSVGPSFSLSKQSLLNTDGTGIPLDQVKATFDNRRLFAGCHVTFGCTTVTEYRIRGYLIPTVARMVNAGQTADPRWKRTAETGIWWGIDTIVAKGLPLSSAIKEIVMPDDKGGYNSAGDALQEYQLWKGNPTPEGFNSPNFDLVFVDKLFAPVYIVPTADNLGWNVNWIQDNTGVLIIKPPDSFVTLPYLYVPAGVSQNLQAQIRDWISHQ